MYEMKPEYYTGIAQIDEEHKKLFEIADEAYELYKNEFIPDKYDHIAKILNELRDYTKIHFQHEEEYMKSINYKGMFMQKVQHDQFCQKLDELDLEHLDENSDEVIQEVLTFLTVPGRRRPWKWRNRSKSAGALLRWNKTEHIIEYCKL